MRPHHSKSKKGPRAHSRYEDCSKMVRLLITNKQLPVLIRAENRKRKKTATVEMAGILSVPPVVLKKHRCTEVLKSTSISP